jgi:hypothetical protein
MALQNLYKGCDCSMRMRISDDRPRKASPARANSWGSTGARAGIVLEGVPGVGARVLVRLGRALGVVWYQIPRGQLFDRGVTFFRSRDSHMELAAYARNW